MGVEIMGLDYLPLEQNILRDRSISSANGAGSPNSKETSHSLNEACHHHHLILPPIESDHG